MAELLADLIPRFLSHMRRKGSPGSRTPGNYGWALRNLEQFLAQRDLTEIGELQEQDLEAWQDSLLARGWAPKSRSLAHTAVRSFLGWLQDRDLVGHRLRACVVSVSAPSQDPRPIEKADVAEIVDYLGPRPVGLRELRDRALWFYLLVTSARISEALQVRRDNWLPGAVIQLKGGRLKRLRVTATVRQVVEDYLAAREDDSIWLWVTTEPGKPVRRLSRDAANRAWRRLARELGVARWSSHRLRDTAGTLLGEAQLPTHLIADHLGHKDLSTVQKYIKVAEEQKLVAPATLEAVVSLPARPVFRPGIVRVRGREDRRSARMRPLTTEDRGQGSGPRRRSTRPD